MESLQPIQLGSTQSYLWEPGDHPNQSGGIPEVLSCTRTQEISRFNGESLKSNRSYLWKDWTIFRFDPFQAIPIQPGEPATSRLNQDTQETLYTSQKSSTTSSHAPAHIGIRRSPLSPNCLIWSLLHSNSNSSFSTKARTR
uniref:Uncharacterized protein n=2 Tax=Brassica oleracea TaxID=3712 RepID=A0A0D3ACC6_BRAOL|nr:unnamed protein product [Brassica oleracea]